MAIFIEAFFIGVILTAGTNLWLFNSYKNHQEKVIARLQEKGTATIKFMRNGKVLQEKHVPIEKDVEFRVNMEEQ